jgi:hypothetical protein
VHFQKCQKLGQYKNQKGFAVFFILKKLVGGKALNAYQFIFFNVTP